MRDFEFFDEIVATYSEEYCIDMDQVFVVGHSLGGWFTNTLACARGHMIRGM
jgi:polyhydroxybutyrate depolymerase